MLMMKSFPGGVFLVISAGMFDEGLTVKEEPMHTQRSAWFA